MVSKVHVSMKAQLLNMAPRASRSRHEGFTLIESMMAAVILTIGLLALTGMQSFSLRKNVDANNQTRVTNLAADMLERVQFNRNNVASYSGIVVDAGTTTCPASAINVMANGDCLQWRTLLLGSNLQNIRGTVTLNPVPPATDPLGLNRRQVTVVVTWAEVAGAEVAASTKSMTLATVISPQ